MDKKGLDTQLKASEELYRLMVEAVKDYAIYRLDPNGFIVTWNEGAKNLKGYTAEEIQGKHYSIFFEKTDVALGKPEQELEQAIQNGRTEDEGWRVRKDGSRFWANFILTPIRDANGQLSGFSKITRDFTAKKQAQDLLQQSEERYRLLVAGVRDYAIFMLGPDFTIMSWNEGAKRLKGYDDSEILHKHFSIFYPKEDIAAGKIEREIDELNRTGRFEEEGWRVRKDGSRFWANVLITRILAPDGRVVGYTKVTRDLTERKRMLDELRQSNELLEHRVQERTEELSKAVAARDEFISIASHELKTPLTALRLNAQIIARAIARGDQLSSEKVQRFAERADKQIDRLTQLIEDMLDATRIQRGTLSIRAERMDISNLLADVLDGYGPEFDRTNSTLTTSIEPALEGQWDRHRIEQVLHNLITNAIKYGAGSEIVVKTWREGECAKLSVRDSGIGISEEDQQRIFERFERAVSAPEISGLGLGLFITKQIVDAHNGSIRVESKLGQGSTFEVTLPLDTKLDSADPTGRDFEF